MPVNLSAISALQPLSTTATAGANTFAPRKTSDAPKEFEAFFLQSFIQEMLPKDAEGVYGSGVAGDIWRSMLSEQLGNQLAKSGGVGIANSLAISRPLGATDASIPVKLDVAIPPLAADVLSTKKGV